MRQFYRYLSLCVLLSFVLLFTATEVRAAPKDFNWATFNMGGATYDSGKSAWDDFVWCFLNIGEGKGTAANGFQDGVDILFLQETGSAPFNRNTHQHRVQNPIPVGSLHYQYDRGQGSGVYERRARTAFITEYNYSGGWLYHMQVQGGLDLGNQQNMAIFSRHRAERILAFPPMNREIQGNVYLEGQTQTNRMTLLGSRPILAIVVVQNGERAMFANTHVTSGGNADTNELRNSLQFVDAWADPDLDPTQMDGTIQSQYSQNQKLRAFSFREALGGWVGVSNPSQEAVLVYVFGGDLNTNVVRLTIEQIRQLLGLFNHQVVFRSGMATYVDGQTRSEIDGFIAADHSNGSDRPIGFGQLHARREVRLPGQSSYYLRKSHDHFGVVVKNRDLDPDDNSGPETGSGQGINHMQCFTHTNCRRVLSIPAESHSSNRNTTIKKDRHRVLGGKYVDYGGKDSLARWTISGVRKGHYDMYIVYANGSSRNRRSAIYKNGSLLKNVNFASTGSWGNWKEVHVPNVFLRNLNTIKIQAITDRGGPNIDHIYFVAVTPHYQAEAYSHAGGDILFHNGGSGYRGDGYMNFGGQNAYIEFQELGLRSCGTWLGSFRYANGSNRNRTVEVRVREHNSGATVSTTTLSLPPTGSWDTYNYGPDFHIPTDRKFVDIKIRATTSGGLNLDEMKLRQTQTDECEGY